MALIGSLIIALLAGAWLHGIIGWVGAVVVGVFVFVIAGSILLRIFPAKAASTTVDPEAEAAPSTPIIEEGAAIPTPPELDGALEALQHERYDHAIELARPHIDSGDPQLKADALRLVGLSLSRTERFAEALPYWEQLIAFESDSSAWLNLASTAACAQHFERALEAFVNYEQTYSAEVLGTSNDQKIFNGFHHANFLASIAGAGRPDLALPHLDLLAGFYRSIGNTDSHLLYTRKLPFFEVFLEKSLPIIRQLKPETEAASWYQAIYDDVDAEGKAMFDRYGIPHGAAPAAG